MPGTKTLPITRGPMVKKLSIKTSDGIMANMDTTKCGEIGDEKGSVHPLLCGHSTKHLLRVIEAYRPIHIEFFTSLELRPHMEAFLKSIQDLPGTFHIEDIPAFTEDSIKKGLNTIISRYIILRKIFPSETFYFGITGGTNTMAVEITLAALTAGEKIHYVVHGDEQAGMKDRIITFNTLELRNMIMNSNLPEGKIHDNV